ncbi:Shedu anti-phage system protein SduA domain-containing protein [[Clostridium] fimetarium]|uniref:Shedu protein SduA C-terminal domain-containing protein n=1 Tax=[Clostridium] fimetarium TaxID=99656 RepID=A0A1I0QUU2_9FIRM|nr:Shedu anti-phage system protein SduA domain-containing protein [[Clostridium] fimetarium]SEW31413.1 protein of unknown function [[Clostridium] fimetarium]
MFKKKYELILDAPKEISWDEYEKITLEEYKNLLLNNSDDEKFFQTFFEENPSYVPGALELFGQSGHYPYMHTLVSQPQIGGPFRRIPDFVWLANDSLTFSPVFIEIEQPSKKMFTTAGNLTANFSQAIGQIYEWKAILNKPVNQLMLFDYFNITNEISKKSFEPQFLLIYGRRAEYENNDLLTGKRTSARHDNIDIISFDRLRPIRDYYQFTSSSVYGKQYNIINIPATYRYRADCADELSKVQRFMQAIDMMNNTSEERKSFLKERYSYWITLGKSDSKGKITGGDGE